MTHLQIPSKKVYVFVCKCGVRVYSKTSAADTHTITNVAGIALAINLLCTEIRRTEIYGSICLNTNIKPYLVVCSLVLEHQDTILYCCVNRNSLDLLAY